VAENRLTADPIREARYRALVSVFGVVRRLLVRKTIVSGLENVPLHGPVLVCMNHLSYADTVLVGMTLPRLTHAFAADKYKKHLFSYILRAAGPIWINREEYDKESIVRALNVLRDGECLTIAPEGTRSHTGAMARAKTGAAYLATRTGAAIVPLAMWGAEALFPGLKKFRRLEELHIVYGKPFRLPEGRARSEQLEHYSEEIMLELARMLPPTYHGYYADHPRLNEPRSPHLFDVLVS